MIKAFLSRKTLTAGIICVGLYGVFAAAAQAQDYLRNSVAPIARHDKRPSPYQLLDPKKHVASDSWGMMFERGLWDKPDPEEERIISYTKLEICPKAETRLIEMSYYSMATDGIDIIYYSPDDPAQKKEAQRFGDQAVPYYPALLREEETDLPDAAQEFARFLQIPCLPTRFRFSFIGSKRYAEYRLGGDAWKAAPAQAPAAASSE